MTDVTTTPTLGDELLADVRQAASDALVTALQVYSGIILAAITNIQTVSDPEQIIAQGLEVEGAVIAAFPTLEQEEIKILATDVKTAVTQLGSAALAGAQALAPTSGTLAAAKATS